MSCFNIFVKGHVHCAQRCLSDIEVGRKKLQSVPEPQSTVFCKGYVQCWFHL